MEQLTKVRVQQAKLKERRQKIAVLEKRILEAAFDGDNEEIEAVIKDLMVLDDQDGISNDVLGIAMRSQHVKELIECLDSDKNSPLSEAAGGGQEETIKLLVKLGADPNKQGSFQRTPLYRASFAGHEEAVKELLELGADPRIKADDNQIPKQVASWDSIKKVFENWDISKTEQLLAKQKENQAKLEKQENLEKEKEFSQLKEKLKNAETNFKGIQKQISKLQDELEEKREAFEVSVGNQKADGLRNAMKKLEKQIDAMKIEAEDAKKTVSHLRNAVQTGQSFVRRLSMKDYNAPIEVDIDDDEDDTPGLKIKLDELSDILYNDTCSELVKSGKWPLILDPDCEGISIFRTKKKTIYLNALEPDNITPEKLRKSLIECIRDGKTLVLDMKDRDMFEKITLQFNASLSHLSEMIMNKTIQQRDKYRFLIRLTDGEEMNLTHFKDSNTKHFKFVLLSQSLSPPDYLLRQTFALRICKE